MGYNKASPFTAFVMLLLFKQRRVSLKQVEFDLYFDTVVEVLEAANDEKYRLELEPKEE